jgi:hypothetical protein
MVSANADPTVGGRLFVLRLRLNVAPDDPLTSACWLLTTVVLFRMMESAEGPSVARAIFIVSHEANRLAFTIHLTVYRSPGYSKHKGYWRWHNGGVERITLLSRVQVANWRPKAGTYDLLFELVQGRCL